MCLLVFFSTFNFLPTPFILCITFFKKTDFIYLFLEKGEGKKKEREKHQCGVASHVPPTRDLAYNPGI